MSSLFIDRQNVQLSLDSGALVLREGGERIGTVPLAPISRVFVRGSAMLPASVLGKLGDAGAGVVILSGRQAKPTLMLSRPHSDARRRIAQVKMALDDAFCRLPTMVYRLCKVTAPPEIKGIKTLPGNHRRRWFSVQPPLISKGLKPGFWRAFSEPAGSRCLHGYQFVAGVSRRRWFVIVAGMCCLCR